MLGVLTLLPAVSVFAYAYGLVNRAIDKWFSERVDRIVITSVKIDQTAQLWQQENAQGMLRNLAANIPNNFEQTRKLLGLHALLLIGPDGAIETKSLESGLNPDLLARNALTALGNEDEVFVTLGGQWIGAHRVDTGKVDKVLAAIFPVRQDIAAISAEMAKDKVESTIEVRSDWLQGHLSCRTGA
jgi:nitrogen fixation/metabolism regulation signal transduction histidine kinase